MKVELTAGSKDGTNQLHGMGCDYFKSTALNAALYGFNGVADHTPPQPGLTWLPCDATGCQATVFDYHCRIVDDRDGELRGFC
jgi:hypothetical protein